MSEIFTTSFALWHSKNISSLFSTRQRLLLKCTQKKNSATRRWSFQGKRSLWINYRDTMQTEMGAHVTLGTCYRGLPYRRLHSAHVRSHIQREKGRQDALCWLSVGCGTWPHPQHTTMENVWPECTFQLTEVGCFSLFGANTEGEHGGRKNYRFKRAASSSKSVLETLLKTNCLWGEKGF